MVVHALGIYASEYQKLSSVACLCIGTAPHFITKRRHVCFTELTLALFSSVENFLKRQLNSLSPNRSTRCTPSVLRKTHRDFSVLCPRLHSGSKQHITNPAYVSAAFVQKRRLFEIQKRTCPKWIV